MANSSNFRLLIVECCSLRVSLGIPGSLLKLSSGKAHAVLSLSYLPSARVGSKESCFQVPVLLHIQEVLETSTRERKNEPWPGTLVQLKSLWRTPYFFYCPFKPPKGKSGSHSVSYIPYQLLPRAKEPGHHSPSGLLFKSLSRSCSSPGLRVKEGVHARILCFWVGRLEVEGWARYLCVQVWSSHSAFLGALQVWTSTVFLHSLHRTAQHQWNLHSHWVTRVTRVVSYPRPQHMISQPSVPLDVLLQTRPAVPREPGLGQRGSENQVISYFSSSGKPHPHSQEEAIKNLFSENTPSGQNDFSSLPSEPGLLFPTTSVP